MWFLDVFRHVLGMLAGRRHFLEGKKDGINMELAVLVDCEVAGARSVNPWTKQQAAAQRPPQKAVC